MVYNVWEFGKEEIIPEMKGSVVQECNKKDRKECNILKLHLRFTI